MGYFGGPNRPFYYLPALPSAPGVDPLRGEVLRGQGPICVFGSKWGVPEGSNTGTETGFGSDIELLNRYFEDWTALKWGIWR